MHAQKLEIHQKKPFMSRKIKELLERKIGGKISKIGSGLLNCLLGDLTLTELPCRPQGIML